MAYRHIVEAGQDVADALTARRAEAVAPSTRFPGCFNSEDLCAFQRRVAGEGFLEAQIVESAYGYSVRYASGLQNWGLIFSARAGQTDGTLEGAIAKARQWQAADPTHRFVTRTVDAIAKAGGGR